jgi:hypothetical protein
MLAWSADQVTEACVSLTGFEPFRGATGLLCVIVRNRNGGERYVVTWQAKRALAIQKLDLFSKLPVVRWLHVRSALGAGLTYEARLGENAADLLARAMEQHGLWVRPEPPAEPA